MGSQQLCLKWKNHHNNIINNFEQLLNTEALVDMTLACEGQIMKVHKVVLSACSPFFHNLLLENPCQHPIIILNGIKYTDLRTIIEFMYHGEVNINQDQLNTLLQTAESLKVNGLTEITPENGSNDDFGVSEVTDDLSNHSYHSDVKSTGNRKKKRKSTCNSFHNNFTDEQISPKIEPPISPELIDVTPDIVVESNSINNRPMPANCVQNQYPTHSICNSVTACDSITDSTARPISALHSMTPSGSIELPSNVNIKISEQCASTDDNSPNLELHNSTSEQTASHQSVFSQLAISSVSITESPLQPSNIIMNTDNQLTCELPGPSNYLQLSVRQDDQQLVRKKEKFITNVYTQPINMEDSLKNLCCPYCKKVYSQSSSLKRHMEIHMLERKTYRCYICQKRFSWKNYLHLHLKRDHGVNIHRN